MKKQIIVIHGGSTYANYKQYFEALKKKIMRKYWTIKQEKCLKEKYCEKVLNRKSGMGDERLEKSLNKN